MADRRKLDLESQLETQLQPAVEAQPRIERRRVPPRLPESVPDAFADLSEGLSTLLRGHLQLARVEMKQDMRAIAREMGMEAAGTPLLLIGLLLLMVGASLALALALPVWAAFLIVGGANVLGGAALVGWATNKLRGQKVTMPASSDELKKDRRWASTLREPTQALRETLH
jgi:uncharacterized membrane protein YqjE